MEAAGFIKRIQRRVEKDRNKSNQYDFSGLIEAVKPYAIEEIKARESQRNERDQRIKRKGKPKLRLVGAT